MKAWKCAFKVEGLNLERFVRLAGEAGIALNSLKRHRGCILSGLAWESDIPALAGIAEQGGWRFAAGDRQGIGHAADVLRYRWFVAAACCLVLAGAFLCTQIMWRIEIIDGGVYEPDIRLALGELGIRTPMLRRGVDPGEIRDALEWRYPTIAWIECGWRGMTLTIRVVEGILPHTSTAEGICDVVASRAGIVSSIVTRAGTPVVKPGELVKAGQVLIKGEERTAGGKLRPVAARGTVNARVWEAAAVETRLYGTQTKYTGDEHLVATIVCPWFSLWPMEDSAFETQDTSVRDTPLCTWGLPFTVHTEKRMEAEYSRVLLDEDQIRQEGARAAMQKLAERTGGEDSLVDKWINWSIIDDEILLSVAVGEMIVDVAEQFRPSGMAATGGQEDQP